MDEGFRYRGFDVHLEVWESRRNGRIRWQCGVTFVQHGLGYAASYSYAAGDIAVLGTPVSWHPPIDHPQYPLGPFSDSRSRF